MKQHKVSMLGTGLIGDFYTSTLHGQRNRDRVQVVYSRSDERGQAFKARHGIPESTTDMMAAIEHPDTDTVVVALPNFLHEEAVVAVAEAGKALLVTKPLGRNGAEAKRMLDAVEKRRRLPWLPRGPGLLAQERSRPCASAQDGALRRCHLGARARGASRSALGLVLGSPAHRRRLPSSTSAATASRSLASFVGKGNRPVEVMCQTDTLVHPIDAEDNAIALVRYESGAIGQFEVSWTFRGGMDLRTEVAGTGGTVWINNFLRTGFEMFTAGEGEKGYVAEKAETDAGWLFPVGDEVSELGYVDMFTDMFDAMDEGREPMETLYDGYVVNAIMDACYKSADSRRWEPVDVDWRGGTTEPISKDPEIYDGLVVIKRELLPDGRAKLILKDPNSGDFTDRVV